MTRHISIVLLIAFSSGLFAQEQDTLKKPRILKQWNLSSDFSEEVDIPFDTVFSLFHRYKIADRYSLVNATLGNYGLPFYQINFFDRITDPDKFLNYYYYPLLHLPENAVFMNTQVPFTELVWSSCGPRETSEQTFRVRHSQNVNKNFNFGLIYDIVFSLGQYSYQRSEDKTFTFYSSYRGDKYKLYFAAGINSLISNENGGIIATDLISQTETRDLPVSLGGLNKAVSKLKNRNLLLVQGYTFGSNSKTRSDSSMQKKQGFLGLSGTFSHIFTLESNRRTYSDDSPGSGFYDTILISDIVTFDSLYSRSINNTIRFDFATDESRKFRLGGGVGLRNELWRYSQIIPTHDTISASDTATWNRSNNILVGRLYNNIGEKFRWVAKGEMFLTGYRAGDFTLNGEIIKSFGWNKGDAFWVMKGGVMNRQPSFWYEQWGSNHFEWKNDLSKEFRVDLGSSFSLPARKAEVKFNYAIIDNYTDFNTNANPSQYAGTLSVLAVSLRKEMQAWKFHLATDLLLQESSNADILDLPLATVRCAGYFEHLFRFNNTGGKLNFQLGGDVTYNTNYHPYAYMPATGRFYRQELTRGNYPYINLFVNFKLKRTRFFLIFDHLNSGMMKSSYEMVPSYPMNVRMFGIGFAWTFYN